MRHVGGAGSIKSLTRARQRGQGGLRIEPGGTVKSIAEKRLRAVKSVHAIATALLRSNSQSELYF